MAVSKRVCIRVPESLRLRLLDRAQQAGTNRSQIVLIALESYLNRQAKTPAA